MSEPRVLLMGAGILGQAYGYCLQQGGAEIHYVTSEEHAELCRQGFTVYPLNRERRERWEPQQFMAESVLTDAHEVASQQWDQVWLCVRSTAVRDGTLLDRIAADLGDTTLVNCVPGVKTRRMLLQRLPEEQVVRCVTTFLAFRAPMRGQRHVPQPGVAYWFPPLTKVPLSGVDARVAPVVEVLVNGGCRAKRVEDATRRQGFASPVMLPWVAALEVAGWSFEDLRDADYLNETASAASREVIDIVAAATDARRPFVAKFLRPWKARWVSRLAARMMPFDLERFVRSHFSTVRAQTRQRLSDWVDEGKRRGLPTETIEEMLGLLAADD